MAIVLNNVTYGASYIAEDDGPLKAGRNYINTDNVTSGNVTINGTLSWNSTTSTGSAVTVSGTLPGGSTDTTLYATPFDNSSYVFVTNNPDPTQATYKFILSNVPLQPSTQYTADNDPSLGEYAANPPCFVTGTRIRVVRAGKVADVAVESLVLGDRAVTASGAIRPIVWIGHSTIGGQRRLARSVMPIRVAAGAFGVGLPGRDLLLSPGHPVLVGADADHDGGWLVPIMCLVNGTTIERLSVDEVTYWHVELQTHDILLAEGLPAESYLDWGNRGFFDDAGAHALADPDDVLPIAAGRCRDVAIDGPVVERERHRLDTVFAMRTSAACVWPSSDVVDDLR